MEGKYLGGAKRGSSDCSSALRATIFNVLATQSSQPPSRASHPVEPATQSSHPLAKPPKQQVSQLPYTRPGLILALIVASDTSMASQLTQEERIQLAIKALQDGTIPSQRQAALIYNVPRGTLQHRFHGRRSAKEYNQSQQRLSVQEEASIKRCIATMTSWGWPVSIKYL